MAEQKAHNPLKGSLAYRWATPAVMTRVAIHVGYAMPFYDPKVPGGKEPEGLIVMAGSLALLEQFAKEHKLNYAMDKAQRVVIGKEGDWLIGAPAPAPAPAPAVDPLDQDDEEDW